MYFHLFLLCVTAEVHPNVQSTATVGGNGIVHAYICLYGAGGSKVNGGVLPRVESVYPVNRGQIGILVA